MSSFISRRCLLTISCAMGVTSTIPINKVEAQSSRWDETWDVIVVGAGAAGLCAAIAAAQNSASVLLIEKMPEAGGNSAICTGDMAVCGSPIQETLGIKDTPEIMATDLMRQGKTSDPERCRFVSSNCLEAWRWTTTELGVEWEPRTLQFDVGQSVPRGHMMRPRTGATLISAALTRATSLKISIRTNCSMQEIIRDRAGDGAVQGIVALENYHFGKTGSGRAINLRALRGVILTFGGFGADVELRSVLDNRLGSWIQTTNQLGSTGESIVAAERAGCQLTGMEHIQALPFLPAEEIGMGTAWPFIEYVTAVRGIWISDNGLRFVNEAGSQRERADVMLNLVRQGRRLYGLADRRAFSAPCPDYLGEKNWEETVRRGVIHQFDSLDALCSEFELPLNVLLDTIKKFNSSMAGHSDAFGRDTTGLQPLEDAPWYMVEIQPKVHHTMGGIKISPAGEVLDKQGQRIEGLFAAGEATGGLFGFERIPSHSITEAVVVGLSAGRLAASRNSREL